LTRRSIAGIPHSTGIRLAEYHYCHKNVRREKELSPGPGRISPGGRTVKATTELARPHEREKLEPIMILCVDDNRDLADSEAMLLQVVGYKALACYDGDSALEMVEKFHPCICLIDLNMPNMNGDVLAERLREESDFRPPVLVAVTARDDRESSRRIKKAGFDLHLIKPVEPTNLLRIIQDMRKAC